MIHDLPVTQYGRPVWPKGINRYRHAAEASTTHLYRTSIKPNTHTHTHIEGEGAVRERKRERETETERQRQTDSMYP